jgi:hypothetical protein
VTERYWENQWVGGYRLGDGFKLDLPGASNMARELKGYLLKCSGLRRGRSLEITDIS